jgi:hypothetical protein
MFYYVQNNPLNFLFVKIEHMSKTLLHGVTPNNNVDILIGSIGPLIGVRY